MNSSTLPYHAIVTVRFSPHVRGEDLAALVQRIIDKDDRPHVTYSEDRRYYDGWFVGFGQGNTERHGLYIRILPSIGTLPFFHFENYYSSALVAGVWMSGSAMDKDIPLDDVVREVKFFARRLEQRYMSATESGTFPTYTPGGK